MAKDPNFDAEAARQARLAAALKANIAKRKGQAKPVEVEPEPGKG
jgi:hypothetical protein